MKNVDKVIEQIEAGNFDVRQEGECWRSLCRDIDAIRQIVVWEIPLDQILLSYPLYLEGRSFFLSYKYKGELM